MNRLQEVLEYNKKFVEQKGYEKYITSKHPDKKMVILTCMDARLTDLLPKAMNIKNGDAKIIKNAGATIAHPFGSAMRSIIVAIYEFNAEDVFIVAHKGCGMSNLDTSLFIKTIINRGVSEEIIDTVYNSGINIKKWLHGFDSVEESVKDSVEVVRKHPLIPKDVRVHGFVIDSSTGELEVIVDGNK